MSGVWFGRKAAGEQEKASKEGLQQSEEFLREIMTGSGKLTREGVAAIEGGSADARNILSRLLGDAGDELRTGSDRGISTLRDFLGQARGDFQSGTQNALQQLMQGLSGSESALGGGFADAQGRLDQVAGLSRYGEQAAQGFDAFDALGQKPDRLSRLLSDPESFKQDPGYQFRQQQGEQAIERSAAARGGRLSGRSMKELSQFNQGLASQEFGAAAQRAQAADAQDMQALLNQAGRSDSASAQRLAQQAALGQAGIGALGQQAGMSAQLGQLLSGGRLGTAGQASGLQQSLGQLLGQAGLGTGKGIAGQQFGLGAQLASLLSQEGQGLSSLFAQEGGNIANLLSAFGGQALGAAGGFAPQFQAPVEFAGGKSAATGASLQEYEKVGLAALTKYLTS